VTDAAAVLGPRRHTVRRAAVFGDQSAAEIAKVAEQLQLDVVQLHGDPGSDDVRFLKERLACAIWPVVRVDSTTENATLPTRASELAELSGWLVLDAKVPGQLGGTGVSLNWEARPRM